MMAPHSRWVALALACLQLLPAVLAIEPNQQPNVPVPVTAPNSPVPVPNNVTVPSQGDLQNDSRTGIPLVDSLHDQAFQAEQKALATLNSTLAAQGISTDVLPSANAAVFNDTAEPGARVGGIGAWDALGDPGWAAKPHAGWNDSFGFTATNMTNGTYAHETSIFVTPAIDLSAYPLQTGTIPYANAGINLAGTVAPYCDQAVTSYSQETQSVDNDVNVSTITDSYGGQTKLNHETCVFLTPDGRALQDLINLAFSMRINVPNGRDGGQVRVFTEKPDNASIRDDPGDLVTPMQYFGEYDQVSAFGTDGGKGPAFTGTHGWTTAVFDLTPYAGRTIWVAFEFASTGASGPSIDKTAPQGWFVDNVTVIAPAVAHDLKLWGIDGPSLRLGEWDHYPRVAPSVNATFSPVVLNAGASPTRAHLHVEIDFPFESPLVSDHEKDLAPGEVWAQAINATIPDVEGRTLNVTATVYIPNLLTGQAPDATANNAATATYRVATVRHTLLTLEPAAIRVDDHAPETVDATVTNAGNVGVSGRLSGSVAVPLASLDAGPATAALPPMELSLAPGESRVVTWALPTTTRGQYNVSAVLMLGGTTVSATTTYFVHASPPPIYASGGLAGADRSGWTWKPFIAEPPNDAWAWKYSPSTLDAGFQEPALIARPNFCAALPSVDQAPAASCLPNASAANEKFGDLRLSIRYASDAGAIDLGLVSITYPLPVTSALVQNQGDASNAPTAEETVWMMDLPGAASGSKLDMTLSNNAWRTIETRVRPTEAQFAHAAEGSQGAQGLRMSNANGYEDLWSLDGLEVRVSPRVSFYLDDLKLTGVPMGSDQRVTILHVTGNPTADTNVNPSEPNCHDTSLASSSCWTSLEPAQRDQWPSGYVDRSVPAADPDLFAYGSATKKVTGGGTDEVLLSPNITLHDAPNATLILDHAYFTNAEVSGNEALIRNIAFVEMQYLRDDGAWSDFEYLVPEGGYPSVFWKSISGSELPPTSGFYQNDKDGVGGADGFYYPAPCYVMIQMSSGGCDQDGYVTEFSHGPTVWRHFDSPNETESVFRLDHQRGLAGVDLSNRVVRFGFRPPEIGVVDTLAYWLIHSIRVLPLPDFAVDGAVDDVKLQTPYDWRAIGVGPGTVVPVNVTVGNRGIYPDDFLVTLNVTRPDGEPFPETQARTGILAAGTTKSVTIAWSVPAEEDRNYTLNVSIVPAASGVHDEFPLNDKMTLGADGLLAARASPSYTINESVVPKIGPAGFARHFFVTMSNTGNEPIADITVTRSVSWTTSMGRTQAPLGGPLAVHVAQLPLGAVQATLTGISEDATFDDLQYTPPQVGSYLLSVAAQSGDTTLSVASDFSALTEVYADKFDHGIDWRSNDSAAWTLVNGPDGSSALAASGPSPGVLPPGLNATIESPLLPLADVRSSTLSLLSKYDLEPGYDGARVEISLPNGSWAPLKPMGPKGLTEDYAGDPLVGSNPMANDSFPSETRALSGDSHSVIPNIDGWSPYTFDLSQVPALQDTVPLDTLRVPNSAGGPLKPVTGEPNALSALWLQTSPGNPYAKWELRKHADHLITDAWWTGITSTDNNAKNGLLSPDFKVFDAEGTDLFVGHDLRVSWWEHRSGASASSPQGVGALYNFTLSDSVKGFLATQDNASTTLLESREGWNHVELLVPSSALAHKRDETININFYTWTPTNISYHGLNSDPITGTSADAATNMGWLIGNVTVEAASLKNGRMTTATKLLARGGTEPPQLADWTPTGWSWLCLNITDTCQGSLPLANAPWQVEDQDGPDGLPAPMWTLGLTRDPKVSDNVDSRIVSPVVDLTKGESSSVTLTVTHKYDLYSKEQIVPTGTAPWMSKWYRGGVVEAQVFDEKEGTWGPWTQVFTRGAAPTIDEKPLADLSVEGAPYTYVFADAGQTFARFPRQYTESVYTSLPTTSDNTPYWRYYIRSIVGDRSFVFSETSKPEPGLNGFRQDHFDLTPFAGHQVRLAFHAWTGNLGISKPGSWVIASATVTGAVLDAGTPRIRLHVATDASNLQGDFAIAHVSLTGITNSRAVGIALKSQPQAVRTNGVANVTGELRNFGPGPRDGLILGVSVTSLATGEPVPLDLGTQIELPAGSGYQHMIAILPLGHAGSLSDSTGFSFNILAGTDNATIKLQVLENVGAGYAPVLDDMPTRTARSWAITVADTMNFAVDRPVVTPAFLATPGNVSATVVVHNDGTLPLEGAVFFNLAGSKQDVLVRALAPGSTRVIASGLLGASAVGNFDLTATMMSDVNDPNVALAGGTHSASASSIVRVGTNELVLSQSFESIDWNGYGSSWGASSDFNRVTDQAKFGNASLLIGVNDSNYAMGDRIDPQVTKGGTLSLSDLDVSTLRPFPELTYWEKARMGPGTVKIVASVAQPSDCAYGMDPATGSNDLVLSDTAPGTESDWVFRDVSLAPLLDPSLVTCTTSPGVTKVNLAFLIKRPMDQGWFIDGIAISSSAPRIAAVASSANISDSVTKDYPFEVENPGLVSRTFDISLDAAASSLAPDQAGWITVEPSVVKVEPGGRAFAHVLVKTPPAIGSFRQALFIVTDVVPRDSPFQLWDYSIALDFDPQPRADLRLAMLVDGQPLVPGTSLQEETPHEISGLVSNIGGAPSVPTTVKLEVIDPSNGTVIWGDTELIDRAIQPSIGGDDVYVVSTHWTPPAQLQPYLLHAEVDPKHLEIDFDRSNDDVTIPINVTQLIRPDLEISPSTATIATPDGHPIYEARPGDLVHVQAVVRNVGNADAKEVVVRLIAGSSVLKEQTIPLLKPNESVLIASNHFVPAKTVVYNFIAFTSDAEQSLSNNAVSLTLPVFPSDISIASPDAIPVAPDDNVSFRLGVTDQGPYPLLLNFSVVSGAPFADVSPAPVALGPNETREITLDLHAPTMATAGAHQIVIEAIALSGQRSQRTLTIDVQPRAAFAIQTHPMTTDPRNATLPVRVENTGNVAMPVKLVVRSEGSVLGTLETTTFQVGEQEQLSVALRLPDPTRVGDMRVEIDVMQGEVLLAKELTTLTLKDWGQLDAEPVAQAIPAGASYNLTLHVSGTAAFVVVPRLDGIPDGARVTFDPPTLKATPGSDVEVRVGVTTTLAPAPGLYAATVRFVDPQRVGAPDAADVPIKLDLRRENVTFLSLVTPSGSLIAGAPQQWRATVRNVGDQPSVEDHLDLYVDQVLVATHPVEPLAPGRQTTLSLAWNGTSGKHGAVLVIETELGHAPWQARADTIDIASHAVPFADGMKQVPSGGLAPVLICMFITSILMGRWRRRGG